MNSGFIVINTDAHIFGMSSSQLTNSYFSEGWLNHQAVFMVCEDWKKVSISKGYNRFSQCPVRPGFHLLGPDSAQCVLLAPRRETTLSQVMTKPHVKPHICIYNHIISYMYIYIHILSILMSVIPSPTGIWYTRFFVSNPGPACRNCQSTCWPVF